jgi:hypothetical protein
MTMGAQQRLEENQVPQGMLFCPRKKIKDKEKNKIYIHMR